MPPLKSDSSEVLFNSAPSRLNLNETPPAFQKRVSTARKANSFAANRICRA